MKQSPIVLLQEIEQRSRQHAENLPQQIEVKATWGGIGVRLEGHTYVVPMDQVKEILTRVSLSRVPGAKPWVRGVANVRGNLLPILDLGCFFTGAVTPMVRQSRVLVMQHKGIVAGLLIEEVLGMRHFFEDEFSSDVVELHVPFAKLLRGQYRRQGESWPVVDINALVGLPEFMQVAA